MGVENLITPPDHSARFPAMTSLNCSGRVSPSSEKQATGNSVAHDVSPL